MALFFSITATNFITNRQTLANIINLNFVEIILGRLYALWFREFRVFVRERSRLIASIFTPVLWLFVIGSGLGSSVHLSTGAEYQKFISPGIISMSIIFSSVFFGSYIIWDRKFDFVKSEIDKMSPKDQAFLLNLMETGIVSETKYGKTRLTEMKTSVFVTSNNIKKLSAHLQSRFFIVDLEPYTYEQFCGITEKLLSRQKIEGQVPRAIADAVWKKSRDLRDCRKIGIMAKTMTDVDFIVDKFLRVCTYESKSALKL